MDTFNIRKICLLGVACDDLSNYQDVTIAEYLKELLLTMWKEKEGFSGKRPFGNSGWEYDVYKCLIVNNIVEGVIDNDGYVKDCNCDKADEIIKECINYIFMGLV